MYAISNYEVLMSMLIPSESEFYYPFLLTNYILIGKYKNMQEEETLDFQMSAVFPELAN